MSDLSKQKVLTYLIPYLKLKNIQYKKMGRITMLKCPFCNAEPFTATILPNTHTVKCIPCERTYNVIDIFEQVDRKMTCDDDIIQELKEQLNIDVVTKIDERTIDTHLNFYVEQGFDLVPIVKGKKIPAEKDWTNKSHKEKSEWLNWLNNGLNVGIKTGKRSNILILDIDQKPVPEQLKKLLGTTLMQESTKGFHYFYKYDGDIPKTRIDEYKLDIESEGGQVVIYPSTIQGIQRKMGDLIPVAELPAELKKFIKSKITVPRKTNSERIREDIVTESFNLGLEAQGQRNSSLIKFGGIVRKILNTKQTENVLHLINKHVYKNPLPAREVHAMVTELEKYSVFDEQELAHKIVKYLREIDSFSSKNDIELAVTGGFTSGENKQRMNKAIAYLTKENKVIQKGKSYKLIKSMEWSENLVNAGTPIKFKVPYLNNIAYFQYEDMLVVGSQNKFGKTTLCMNMVKRVVDQRIKPYYIYNETGARFAKTALKLGMKDGDFKHVFVTDPEEVIFEQDSVIIFDWVKPSDFAKTADVFSQLVEKAKKSNSFLICFVQLKKDNSFFAPNLIGQYPALLCRYIYDNEEDGTHTKFQIDAVRDPKITNGKKTFQIPCVYDWQTKEVHTIEEVQEKENKCQS